MNIKKYRCSVCKEELTQEEYMNYARSRIGLDFEWGFCQGETATIELITEGDKQ